MDSLKSKALGELMSKWIVEYLDGVELDAIARRLGLSSYTRLESLAPAERSLVRDRAKELVAEALAGLFAASLQRSAALPEDRVAILWSLKAAFQYIMRDRIIEILLAMISLDDVWALRRQWRVMRRYFGPEILIPTLFAAAELAEELEAMRSRDVLRRLAAAAARRAFSEAAELAALRSSEPILVEGADDAGVIALIADGAEVGRIAFYDRGDGYWLLIRVLDVPDVWLAYPEPDASWDDGVSLGYDVYEAARGIGDVDENAARIAAAVALALEKFISYREWRDELVKGMWYAIGRERVRGHVEELVPKARRFVGVAGYGR